MSTVPPPTHSTGQIERFPVHIDEDSGLAVSVQGPHPPPLRPGAPSESLLHNGGRFCRRMLMPAEP